MKKILAILTIFSTLIFSSQAFAAGDRNHIVNIDLMAGTGGSFKYYECATGSDKDFVYALNYEARNCANAKPVLKSFLSAQGGLGYAYESKNAYTLNYKFGLTMGHTFAQYPRTIFTLILNVDNILYADLVPDSVDFLKFDLGLNIRGGFSKYFVNLMPYMRLTAMVPDTGLKMFLETNIGTLDIYNSDVKASLGYEFGTVGIELGYKYLGRSYTINSRTRNPQGQDFRLSGKSVGINAFFFSTYFKF